MHIHRSRARGDQLHLGQRMWGPVGPRLETLSTLDPGSAVRAAERRTRLGRDTISTRVIGNRPTARTDGLKRSACSRARAQESQGIKRSLIHSERDHACYARNSPARTHSPHAAGNSTSASRGTPASRRFLRGRSRAARLGRVPRRSGKLPVRSASAVASEMAGSTGGELRASQK